MVYLDLGAFDRFIFVCPLRAIGFRIFGKVFKGRLLCLLWSVHGASDRFVNHLCTEPCWQLGESLRWRASIRRRVQRVLVQSDWLPANTPLTSQLLFVNLHQ